MGTTIVVPIYAFVGAKGAWFCRFLAHSSLKLGHLEKSLGVFCSYECPLSTLQISAKSPQGSPRNVKSREVFFNVSRSHNPVMLIFSLGYLPEKYLSETN